MKIRVVLAVAVACTLASCNGTQTAMYAPDAWHNAPVDLSLTRQAVTSALHSENGDIRDFFQTDILSYGLPEAVSDWQIEDSIARSDHFTAKAVSRFNSYMAVHNIFSYLELFERERTMGYELHALNMMENIMGFKPTVAASAEIRNTIDTLALYACRQIGSAAFGTMDECNPEIMVDSAYSLLAIEPMYDIFNDIAIDKAVQLQLSWSQSFDTLSVSEIGACNNLDTCLNMFFDAMEQAPDYDSQCALAMACVNMIPSEFVLPAIQALLESGHYSKYSFIMWLGWRSAMQYFYFGPSRDAQIADSYFNIQRKNTFMATINYLQSHPDDFSALLTLEWLCSTGNIIRNGSNISGNDSPLDYKMVFGN